MPGHYPQCGQDLREMQRQIFSEFNLIFFYLSGAMNNALMWSRSQKDAAKDICLM